MIFDNFQAIFSKVKNLPTGDYLAQNEGNILNDASTLYKKRGKQKENLMFNNGLIA